MENVNTKLLGTSNDVRYSDNLLIRRMYGCGKSKMQIGLSYGVVICNYENIDFFR